MQSDVGIAISDTRNNFTPASDVILGAERFSKLPALLRLCADGKKIIIGSFILSILYNIVGVYFSVTAQLSPLVAAILMPASTFSIIIFTYTTSLVMARYRRLSTGAA
jgi:Cu+-exporting ATPase